MTNKFISKISAILLAIIIGIGASSCNSDSNNGYIPDDLCADFVTFVSSNDKGSVFTFQKSGDSELITLVADVKIDTEQIKPGSRVIIQYLPSGGQKPYESGAINLYGISRIFNAGIEEETLATIESWGHNALKVYTIARSGKYLDFWAEGAYVNSPSRFGLYVDNATLENEYPELYLVYVSDNDLGRNRQIYASFDLAKVWDLDTSKGAKVTYYSTNGTETLTLHKPNKEPLQPGTNEAN